MANGVAILLISCGIVFCVCVCVCVCVCFARHTGGFGAVSLSARTFLVPGVRLVG